MLILHMLNIPAQRLSLLGRCEENQKWFVRELRKRVACYKFKFG